MLSRRLQQQLQFHLPYEMARLCWKFFVALRPYYVTVCALCSVFTSFLLSRVLSISARDMFDNSLKYINIVVLIMYSLLL